MLRFARALTVAALALVAAPLIGCAPVNDAMDHLVSTADAAPPAKGKVLKGANTLQPGAGFFEYWTVTHTPSTAAQATASKAANAGAKHVAYHITAVMSAGATAATPVVLNLRDGATGAGTVLWSHALSAIASSTSTVDIVLNPPLIGSTNTAMTLEFTGAGAAATQEIVDLSGYDLSP